MSENESQETEIALLKQRLETVQKDVSKNDERVHKRVDDLETRLQKRLEQIEGLHRKVLYAMALGLVSFVSWFAKVIADKSGIGS